MRTYTDQIGSWTRLDVRAHSHAEAVREARGQARRSGLRVVDVAGAARQDAGRRWVVECRVEAR